MLWVNDAEFRSRLSAVLPRLSRFGFALTRNRPDADDLLQMTCERALSRIDQWRRDTRLDSWMFRIMQSIWFNELRSRKVRERHLQDEQHEEDGPAVDGEGHADARLMLNEVAEAALQLPDELRAVLMLVCVEGLTYKETAETLSIPIGTVMSRLSRARLTLMRVLAEDTEDGVATVNVVRLDRR